MKIGSRKRSDVIKVQSWLTLFAVQNAHSGTATAIDGVFGPATEHAVKIFQRIHNLTVNGIVTQEVFDTMSAPLKIAFEKPLQNTDLRSMVIEAAHNHLQANARELNIKGKGNSGPWVRSYMDRNEGNDFPWCVGFVQTILDQACSSQHKDFTKLVKLTYSCDVLGTTAKTKKLLIRNNEAKNDSSQIKPGDIFLINQVRDIDWTHTGIVTAIINQHLIETIEGNTNEGGSREGTSVLKRTRNFTNSKIDFFSITPLVN